ncbi:MAG: septum formation initiator family protein [bacterium]
MRNYLGIILFILIVGYFIFLIRQDIIDNLELRRSADRLGANIVKEEILAEQYKQRLNQLRNKGFIEQLARTKLGLVKQGETAYKVLGGE